MATPITFILYNNSSTAAVVNDLTFNTAPNIRHLSTLTDFGIGSVFTGSYVASGVTLPANSSLSLTSYYSTQTGLALPYADYLSTVIINSTLAGSSINSTITNYVTFSSTPLDPPWIRPPIEGTGGGGSAGGGGGGWDIIPLIIVIVIAECFTANTQVLMEDGTTKSIKDVELGDRVYNHDRSQINTVVFLEQAIDSMWLELYSPTPDLEPFATVNHPLYIDGRLSAVDPETHFDLYPWLGQAAKIANPTIVPAQGKPVYNLWVDGDHTYTVNGYGTTSIIDDGAFMRQAYEYGYTTHAETLGIMHTHSNNGRALRVGSYYVNHVLGLLDFKPLTKLIARTLIGPETIPKRTLFAGLRLVGLIAGLIHKIRN